LCSPFPAATCFFIKLTLRLLQHTCRFLIYKINDKNTEIGLETTGEKEATYAQFLALLPENDCRYCVYDFE
jgi:cofilin